MNAEAERFIHEKAWDDLTRHVRALPSAEAPELLALVREGSAYQRSNPHPEEMKAILERILNHRRANEGTKKAARALLKEVRKDLCAI